MYRQGEALIEFDAPFTAIFDRTAAPDGRGYGVLLDARGRLVSYFRTKKAAADEARQLNREARMASTMRRR